MNDNIEYRGKKIYTKFNKKESFNRRWKAYTADDIYSYDDTEEGAILNLKIRINQELDFRL